MLKLDELEDVIMGFFYRKFITNGRFMLSSRELYGADAVFKEHHAMVSLAVRE